MNFIPEYMRANIQLITAALFLIMSIIMVFLSVKIALERQGKFDRRLASAETSGSSHIRPASSKERLAWLSKFASHLTLPDTEEISRIRYLLSQAGFFSPSAVNIFYLIRVLAIIVPQLILIGFWGVLSQYASVLNLVLCSVMLAGLGFIGPGFVVGWFKARRSLQCREGFPDMMDLLVACVEAGLSLDAAFIRVANELGDRYPALKVGLDMMNLELRAGRARHEAMINFARRIDLDEAKSLAVTLKQSEEMGSSLGTALRTFSEEMRATRMLVAEEKALALSAKLTLPLILFIFPTIMLILLLPAGIRLVEAL